MEFRYHENAFTGLEAAIVLIAFVVVAAVFSYVVLGAGFFTTQKTQETVYKSVEQSTSNILIKGSVYGFADGTNLPIKTVNMTLGVAPGAPAVDLTKMKIVYSNATVQPQTLTYVASTTLPTANSTFSASANSISGDDQVTISVPISAGGAPPNTDLTIELRPPGGGAPIPLMKTIPSYTTIVNILR
jgi:flagellin FlaB